jgi:hypothetical protein
MKKLLTTTALAAVFISGSAIAQTTVTGELRIGYKSVETVKGTSGSNNGFGTETQINLRTKGKTNLGFDYAAGTSLENDGDQTAAIVNEETYIDFISGNTTISIGRDHIQRSDSDRSAAQLVGYAASEIAAGVQSNIAGNAGATSTTSDSLAMFQGALGAAPSASFGIAALQKTQVGTFSINFVPTNAAPGTSESYNGLKGKSAYELGYTGDLGVKGLNVIAFKNSEHTRDANTAKREATNLGANYNFGSITVAYNQKDHKGSGAIANKAADIVEKQYALAYAVTPTLTVAVRQDKASGGGLAETGKINSLQLGYNLGPVALIAGVADVSNVAGGTSVVEDARVGFVQLRGAF